MGRRRAIARLDQAGHRRRVDGDAAAAGGGEHGAVGGAKDAVEAASAVVERRLAAVRVGARQCEAGLVVAVADVGMAGQRAVGGAAQAGGREKDGQRGQRPARECARRLRLAEEGQSLRRRDAGDDASVPPR